MTTVKQEVRHTLRIMDQTGHTELAWSPANAEETAKVKAEFEKLVGGLNSLAYTMPEDGSMGTAIREFDPEVSITITPQMQGG